MELDINLSPEPITISTLSEGRYLDVNESFLRLMGLRREEVLGRTSREIGFWLRPEDCELFVRVTRERGRAHDLEFRFRTRAGQTRVGLFSSEAIEVNGESCVLSITRDVTASRELEQQLHQSQKMEAIGLLAGGMAHDFNNLLMVINGYCQVIVERMAPDNPLVKYVREIHQAGERAASLTVQLLTFARRQAATLEVVDLNAVVDGMQMMLRRIIGEDIALIMRAGVELGQVRANKSQIELVIVNLAVNARDAMPHGGDLTLETGNLDLDERFVRHHVNLKPGPHVFLSVSDTGMGMDTEVQKHIFEPFFTTKENGKGTGLGLSTVYDVIRQSGGSIGVYSEPGHGTTFNIYLPCVAELPVALVAGDTTPIGVSGTESVLLVEDDASVRILVSRTLEAYGYAVLEASDGPQALKLAGGHPEKLDVLVTDLVMPSMDGHTLAGLIAKVRPEIKVLFMSGYTDHAVFSKNAVDRDADFIQKPFTGRALAQKLRTILDAR